MVSAPILRPVLNVLSVCAAALAILATTACSHRPPGGPRAQGKTAEPDTPTLVAEEPFFEGMLLVKASVGSGFDRRQAGGRGPSGPGAGGGRRGGPPPGGMGGGGPGMGGGGERGDRPSMGNTSGSPSIRLQEAGFPPVALEVKLTNKGGETVEVAFLQCKSALGDFAVRPEKLALAPGQSAAPDRMTSHLGLTTSALELTLRLRLGQTVETKVLVLRPQAPMDATAGAPRP